MRHPQMSFLRLLLLHVPPAFSTTFRHVCSAFVSCAAVAPSPRRSTRRWCTNLNKKQELALRQDEWKGVSDVLVCGDGDLSYSAWLTQQLGDSGVSLTATVLESKEAHNTVYKNSQMHTDRIRSGDRHKVFFGIDATQLSHHFCNASFDRIIFNFPHWRGKANNKRNRELLNAFLGSASEVLNPDGGKIQVALCEGQGGATVATIEEWRQSWTAALFAAENGLLLVDVKPYEPAYDLSSHRGVDRPFRVGGSAEVYTFAIPNDKPVDESIQLCCQHELHLVVPNFDNEGMFTRDGLIDGDEVLDFVRERVSSSIRVEIPIRQVLSPLETRGGPEMIVFLIVYCGERQQLTRAMADSYRDRLEYELSKHLELRENRKGRMVSRPFPYPLLQELIDKQTGD